MATNNRTKKRWQVVCLLSSLLVTALLLQHFDKPMVINPKKQPVTVYTPDWGVAGTLINMGYPPFATSEPDSYQWWVTNPPLPDDIYNMGMRSQPNIELLNQLHPDVIIYTPSYASNSQAYPQDITTLLVDFKSADTGMQTPPSWEGYADIVHQISQAIGQPELAQPYIDDNERRIIDAGINIRAKLGDNRKILVSNFWDMRQLSVLNNNSTIKLSADMMGLDLLSIAEPTKWGSSYVYPSVLYDLPDDTCLIVLAPIPEMTKVDSLNSAIWQNTPFFKPDACLYTIAPMWERGGIESVRSFAENLEAAVMYQDRVDDSNRFNSDVETVTNIVVNDISYDYVHAQEDAR